MYTHAGSARRDKRPGDIPGSVLYSVIGDHGAISYALPASGKPGLLGVHSHAPTRTGTQMKCQLLPGGSCYAGGLPGNREEAVFAAGGEDALYRELESWYRAHFPEG